jgi:hypothetical protein
MSSVPLCVHVCVLAACYMPQRAPASFALLQHAEQQMRPQKQQALTETERHYYVTQHTNFACI